MDIPSVSYADSRTKWVSTRRIPDLRASTSMRSLNWPVIEYPTASISPNARAEAEIGHLPRPKSVTAISIRWLAARCNGKDRTMLFPCRSTAISFGRSSSICLGGNQSPRSRSGCSFLTSIFHFLSPHLNSPRRSLLTGSGCAETTEVKLVSAEIKQGSRGDETRFRPSSLGDESSVSGFGRTDY